MNNNQTIGDKARLRAIEERLATEGVYALPELKEYVAAFPDDLYALGSLAYAYQVTGLHDQSKQSYEAYLASCPNDADAWYYYGMSLAALFRRQAAARAWWKSLRLAPLRRPFPLLTRLCSVVFVGGLIKLGLRMRWLSWLYHRGMSLLNRYGVWLLANKKCAQVVLVAPTNPQASFQSMHAFFEQFATSYPEYRQVVKTYFKNRELQIANHYFSPEQPMRVLDLGTGLSLFPVYLKALGMQVVCLDGDEYGVPGVVDAANSSAARSAGKLDYLLGDMRVLPFADRSFDRVLAICAVEHIPEHGDTQTMREIARVLRPGGLAIMTTEAWDREVEYWRDMPFDTGYQYDETAPQDMQASRGFYRTYTRQTIMDRLVQPSGLQVMDKGFFFSLKHDWRGCCDAPQSPLTAFLLREIQPTLALLTYQSHTWETPHPIPPSAIVWVVLARQPVGVTS